MKARTRNQPEWAKKALFPYKGANPAICDDMDESGGHYGKSQKDKHHRVSLKCGIFKKSNS
jgi:hypothetical protein